MDLTESISESREALDQTAEEVSELARALGTVVDQATDGKLEVEALVEIQLQETLREVEKRMCDLCELFESLDAEAEAWTRPKEALAEAIEEFGVPSVSLQHALDSNDQVYRIRALLQNVTEQRVAQVRTIALAEETGCPAIGDALVELGASPVDIRHALASTDPIHEMKKLIRSLGNPGT